MTLTDDFKEAEQRLKGRVITEQTDGYQTFKNLSQNGVGGVIKLTNFIDNVNLFYDRQPFFYDNAGLFWFWKGNRYEQVDDIDLMNNIDEALGFMGQTVNASIKGQYMEAFRRIGRKHIPKNAPAKWIQFDTHAFSIESKNIYEVKPNYFFTNPIPWKVGNSDETPIMDKLFKEWVGEKYVPTLYELLAYCCYTDYPIQLLFCLSGSGRNGKSCFLKVLEKFIGNHNVTSTSLDLITGTNKSRFEQFKLYKKLVALMGETNFGLLTNTSLLKQLTGGDMIGFEKKGKDPFDDYSYAKVLIASNSLPTTQDTSDGFFRRWMIIDFYNEFPEGKDITKTIPEIEYNNLARKCLKIIPELVERGMFTNQGDIPERKRKYLFASNPLQMFLKNCCICDTDDTTYTSYNELYTAYVHFLKNNKKRKVSLKEFKGALEDEGYWVDKSSKKVKNSEDYEWKNSYWIEGVKLKPDWDKHLRDNWDNSDIVSNSFLIRVNGVEIKSQMSQKSQQLIDFTESISPIHHHCNACGATPCYVEHSSGKTFCNEDCLKVWKVQQTDLK